MKYIKTYIEGLDKYLNGGIPHGTTVLLCGMPGMLKTSLSFSILYNNVKRDRLGCIFFSFAQPLGKLLMQMESLGLKYNDVRERLSIVDKDWVREKIDDFGVKQTSWQNILRVKVENMRSEVGCDLIAFDSIDAVRAIFNISGNAEMLSFVELLSKLNLTAIITHETHTPDEICGDGIELFCDGIFHIKRDVSEGIHDVRKFACVKLIGTDHSLEYVPIVVKDGKIRLLQEERAKQIKIHEQGNIEKEENNEVKVKRADRISKIEPIEKAEKVERVEKGEQVILAEAKEIEKVEKPVHVEKQDKPQKLDRSERIKLLEKL
jgi:KaiC/GvpD/RAD55 family RecA-like ATPase